jgi:hypothetical protein
MAVWQPITPGVGCYYNNKIDILPISDDAYKQKIHVVAAWRRGEDNPLVKRYRSFIDKLDCYMPAPGKLQDFVKSNWYLKNKKKATPKCK